MPSPNELYKTYITAFSSPLTQPQNLSKALGSWGHSLMWVWPLWAPQFPLLTLPLSLHTIPLSHSIHATGRHNSPHLGDNSQVQMGNRQRVAPHPRCLSALLWGQCVRCLTVPAPTLSYRAGLRVLLCPIPSVPTIPCGIFSCLHFTEETALGVQAPTSRTVSQCFC